MSNHYRLYRHPNGIFYHRVKVPADIRQFHGKQIEQSSLQTRDIRNALRRLPAVIVAVDEMFERLRRKHTDQLSPSGLGCDSGLTQSAAAKRFSGQYVNDIQTKSVAIAANELGNIDKVPVRSCIPEELDGKRCSESTDLPLMSAISKECFAALRIEKRWSEKTTSARHMQIAQIIEICGDRPLNRYTQDDVRLLKRTLFSLPPQSRTKPMFSGLSKLKIAEHARQLGLSGLSAESVRQILTAANLVFGWARAEHDINLLNIVQPMIPPPSSGRGKREKREAFCVADLQKIFSSAVFTGVHSYAFWLKPGSLRLHDTGRFWVPLLALYSGVRLMEAVQLLRQDVGCENGIWYIDVNDDDVGCANKSVKNEASIRRIPVHPALISLGFLDFVQMIKAGERLFPDVEIGPGSQRHRHASKMFNRLLTIAGVKTPTKVWHSLRHSFEQACRESGVDSAIMDQLQGHTQKGMRKVYGQEGYPLKALYDAICSIQYVGLDLSHILSFRRSGI